MMFNVHVYYLTLPHYHYHKAMQNPLFTLNRVQYIPSRYPVKCLSIKCIPFYLTFWSDLFMYYFLVILQFQLFWNNHFIICISNIQITMFLNLMIFSSDLNFFTKFTAFDIFFYFCRF